MKVEINSNVNGKTQAPISIGAWVEKRKNHKGIEEENIVINFSNQCSIRLKPYYRNQIRMLGEKLIQISTTY